MLQLIQKGLIWYIHAGVPCTVWSIARKGITQHDKARAREAVAVELTMFCVAVFRAMSRIGRFWSMENPATSKIFQLRPVVELFGLPNVQLFTWDMCAWGEPHKKPTSLLTNMPALSTLAQRCSGDHKQVILSGREQYIATDGGVKWRNRTSAAGEYPWSLRNRWADTLFSHAPYIAGTEDTTGFADLVHERLKEIAGKCPFSKGVEEAKNHPDLQPSDQPLHRARGYRRPIIFGQHTKEEAAWLRRQGA